MGGTVWLIVESDTDGRVLKALFAKRFPQIHVEYITSGGSSPNISRLESELTDLIKRARKGTLKRPWTNDDCIIVIHDDDMIQSNRTVYTSIKQKCDATGVLEIIAKDELEAWLLSDSKLSQWLGIKQETWNSKQRPSDDLKSLLKKKRDLRYPADLHKVLPNIEFDGTNTSFQEAVKTLKNLPCISA